MLVLNRKIGEKIVIPNCNISVTVMQMKGNRVSLGIVAPSDVPVHRAEVWRRICVEEQSGCEPFSQPDVAIGDVLSDALDDTK